MYNLYDMIIDNRIQYVFLFIKEQLIVKVQEVMLSNNVRRYMLIYENGEPAIPVIKYLKYMVNTGKSVNTQRTYCYGLKNYFEYLKEINKTYKDINLNDLSNFTGWLKNPFENMKITPLKPMNQIRSNRTVNHNITVVMGFYDYLFRNGEIDLDYKEKSIKNLFLYGNRKYRNFLFHITKNNSVEKNILKLKINKSKLKVFTKNDVEKIYNACTNIRDKFLIKLLFETGMRIGEALSLYKEDFIFSHLEGHKIRLTDRGELQNGAKLKSGEREINVSQDLMDLFDDYMYEITDIINTSDFVLVKLKGGNKGKAMEYQDVVSLMRRLEQKTEMKIHAHLFRHTHATIYYNQVKDIKHVQERLGHTQIQTTMNFYLHPSEDDISRSWNKAQDAFKFNTTIGGNKNNGKFS